MASRIDVRHGDLWTEAVRALGIRASGARSPFRNLETREDALVMVRECAVALSLGGLVQIALALLAGVGSAVDALVYLPIAIVLHRFNSRVAAYLLLAFSLFAVAVVVIGSLSGVEASTDLVLIAILLWAAVRAVEATARVHAEPLRSGAERPPIVLGSREAVSGGSWRRRPSSSAAWLTFAALAFLLAAAPRWLMPLFGWQDFSLNGAPAARPVAARTVENPKVASGDGRLALSAPVGLIEPRTEEPGIGTIAEGFVPPAMELAALFVSPTDLDAFRRDHQFAPARYVMIQTVRQPSVEHVSQEEFLAAKSAREDAGFERLGRMMGADATLSQWLAAASRPAGSVVDLDGARVRGAGVLAESDRSVSFGSIVEVGATGDSTASRVVVTSLVLARGRILVVYAHGTYATPDDVSSARDVARDVIRNVVNENPA